jgi:hypothetical protein
MSGYVNKTSLRFIFAFMIIIAVSVGLFELLHRLEENAGTPPDALRAEPETSRLVE